MPEELTTEQKEKLMEMIDTWDTARRAILFINFVGRTLKWVLGIGSAIAIIWSAVHGGSPK